MIVNTEKTGEFIAELRMFQIKPYPDGKLAVAFLISIILKHFLIIWMFR